jgi:plasmid stabilization system protein ParE
MSRFALTRRAATDLEEIVLHVADDNLGAAYQLRDRFFDLFDRLARMPLMGHLRPDLTPEPVRFSPLQTYLVIYRPVEDGAEILRVLSGYRDVAALLGHPRKE